MSDAALDRVIASITKTGTAHAVRVLSNQSIYNGPSYGVRRQYIYGPVGAQTISGNVKGQLYCSESSLDTDAMRAVIIRVIGSDGSTVRGTSLSHLPVALASEYAGTVSGSSEVNRNFPPSTALTNVDAQNGDYIVIEIGHAWFKASGTERFIRFYAGDNQASDAPEDETDTNRTSRNPWIEFSMDIAGPSVPAMTSWFRGLPQPDTSRGLIIA